MIQAGAIAGAIAVFVWRAWEWLGEGDAKTATFLALSAAGQALPMLAVGVGDRYFIPVAVALVPAVAASVSRSLQPAARTRTHEGLARWCALAGLAAGLLVYAAGETDYVAWHVARDAAAQLARTGIDSSRVDGGDEDFATHILIPYYDRNGVFPPYVTPDGQSLRDPKRVVDFGAATDPAPGATYGDWTRGKIIVRCIRIRACGAGLN